MRKILPLFVLVLIAVLSGCSWGIKLDPGGKQVHTAWNDNVSSCKQLGKITVSVMDRVGPVDRNDIKVRDELEVMARNQAATMGADTVKPLAEPSNGAQAWGAYQCGAGQMTPAGSKSMTNPAAAGSSAAKTYPVQTGG
jgi:hypothetical protein